MAKKKEEEVMDESMMDIVDDDVMDEPDPEPLPKGSEALVMVKKITAKLNKAQNKKMFEIMLTVLEHDKEDIETDPPPIFYYPIISKVDNSFLRRQQRDFLKAFDTTPTEIRDLTDGRDFDEWAEGFELEDTPLNDKELWCTLDWSEFEGEPRNNVDKWIISR